MNVGNYVTAGLWYHRFKGSSSFLPHKQIITTATILAQILTPQSKYVSVLGGVLTQNLNVQICGGNDRATRQYTATAAAQHARGT